jgi:aspartate racemase
MNGMTHKKIGIIGGLSPESTASYYLHITRSYVARFGADSYPDILIYSVNLDQYHRWRDDDRWDLIANDLSAHAETLRKAGAEIGIIATNTMHKVFETVQASTELPLLHILDATISAIQSQKVSTVALLGTSFTMNQRFYRDRLEENGIVSLVPDDEDQLIIHEIIINELVRGEITTPARDAYLRIVDKLTYRGAEGVILGCTEIPLLLEQKYCALPLFDTASLHAIAALDAAIA